MIDAPGPWASGAFTLVEGRSLIETEAVVTDGEDRTWLQTEHRSPTVRLRANPHYWDRKRGPRLAEVEFRNDLDAGTALDLVCDSVGEVDIVTEVPHASAARVRGSRHARLVTVDAVRALAGVIDRDADGLPLSDVRARRALNLAIDRAGLVRDVFGGLARPLAGLTPPTPLTVAHRAPDRLLPYRHDAAEAARLWQAAGGAERPLRLAAFEAWGAVAAVVAEQWRLTLGVTVEVSVLRRDDERETRRALAGKGPRNWDVLLLEQGSQSVDVPPLELHRGFVGRSGEFRAGPVDPVFERLFADLVAQTSQLRQVVAANRIDRYVTEQALALFLVAPKVLYAVNREVDFRPYATSFELADTSVRDGHWSLAEPLPLLDDQVP
ncbi:peptide/nickel transport system substrate-binding protein [Blastococcus colisei]|uniref:Peptide/nickel transport system substrate-binding protein n=1 Tax=Blastococcus colisei TaxID=1564162 RepID=A0A543PJT7_9ACTN|nr:ABC transporter substrate-binding protein [Blastococcus colisei]TQN44336.1 peptide/nickel transport system substrate-binding protein [Blastococcus colisei]